MVNPLYVLVDLAIAVLAARSIRLLRREAPWGTLGWGFAFLYGVVSAVEFSLPPVHRLAGRIAYGAVAGAALAFIVSGIRSEPQGDPWWWPRRTVRRTPRPRRP